MFGRRVNVYYELDAVDVHAAGSHVGCHEHAVRTVSKQCEVAVTCRLRQVAVQVNGGDTSSRQLFSQALGVVLGTHKQNAATGARRERLHHFLLGLG